jgi:hypothetical protein
MVKSIEIIGVITAGQQFLAPAARVKSMATRTRVNFRL